MEQLVLQLHSVRIPVKHANQEPVCVELLHLVLAAQQHRLVTLLTMYVNVEQPQHVQEVLQQIHAMKPTIYVFVELLELQQLHVRFPVKHVNQERVCVEQLLHVVEILQLQLVMLQIMYASAVQLHHVLEAQRHRLVTKLTMYVNVVQQHHVPGVQQRLHVMNLTTCVFVEL